ncbi:hypothetical protein ACRALDRAFT_2054935 [Sodiomyces alcalophilus JCM 7366]|uniref:uncharacterized protein n=1 Tax=Sodiomyces alcalophilus JCM 7366 TaxID=591952 RepID=UPI0039B398F2
MSHGDTNRTVRTDVDVSNKSTYGGSTTGDSSRRSGIGRRTFSCPEPVAYTEHVDYPTATGVVHHEAKHSHTGTYQGKDVERRSDGSEHIHRVYENPSTGTRIERDIERRDDGGITHVHKVYRNATTGDGL